MGSSLVTVHNQKENVYIQRRHNGDKSRIGLNDRSVEGSFVWTNKELSSFRFWARNQPNNWKNEDCVHTLDSWGGYTWNDVPCDNCYNFTRFTDLDECDSDSYDCGINAVCQNTASSYTCTCKAGYTGDGRTCVDLNECSSNSDICHINAICRNTVGSYTCTCKPGYKGDGRTCSPNGKGHVLQDPRC
ncbi:E-selectin-like [Porites lutea]|uniref:E-selectin-like n=1 Tax=Porites lutea TaxID=51062 RepID=UPI003CC54BEB